MDKNSIIFSINMLTVKNNELIKSMKEILSGVVSKSLDIENYTVESNFGNKIVKGSVVSPSVASLALENIRELKHRVLENNVEIERLRSNLPVDEYTLSQSVSILINEGLISGTLLQINLGSTEIQTSDGKVVVLKEGDL